MVLVPEMMPSKVKPQPRGKLFNLILYLDKEQKEHGKHMKKVIKLTH